MGISDVCMQQFASHICACIQMDICEFNSKQSKFSIEKICGICCSFK